jgi:hypothetical protein
MRALLNKISWLRTPRYTDGRSTRSKIKDEARNEKKQAEVEIWARSVQQEALGEAGKKVGTLTLGDLEAQLKKVSEQVTREAQEKQERQTRKIISIFK